MHRNLSDETWNRIHERAKQEQCSADDLINRLLDYEEKTENLSSLKMQQLIRNLPLAIAIFDREMRYLHVNQTWRDQYRLDDNVQLIGKTHYEIFTEIGDDWKQIHQECLNGAVNSNPSAPFPRIDGSLDWIRWDVRPWYSDAEETTIGGIMMITEVITERIEMERSLEQSKDRYRLLTELTIEGIVIHQDGLILDVNPAMLKLFGYDHDTLVEKHISDILIIPETPKSKRKTNRFDYSTPIKVTAIHKDRHVFPMQLRSRKIEDDLQVMSLLDMSEQKRIETALQERDLLFRLAFDSSPDAINLNRVSDGMYIDVNQGFCNILGYHRDEIIGKTSLELNIWNNAQERDQLVSELGKKGYIDDLEAEYRHKNGELVIGLMSARILSYAGEDVILSVTRDITEYKYNQHIRQEYEYLKSRFHKEHEHNEFVQRIISTLSHDLRSPLAIISSSRDMLANYYDRISEEERKERLKIIGSQIHFALEILEDTVSLARGNLTDQAFNPTDVNLAALCQVSVKEIQVTQDGNHIMQFINVGDIDLVRVDEVLVSRILLNLLSNAIKYSPEGTEITLELDGNDDTVTLRVIDQGIGIENKDLPFIFDPFYRADGAYTIGGTGLGLSIVKNCVERHNGTLEVITSPGVGSRFTVTLPVGK